MPVWTGLYVTFCADYSAYDSALGQPYAPSTNRETHYIFDECGNLVATGTSSGWTDNGNHPPGYISDIAGSSLTRMPAVPINCYGVWTVLYEFTQTFTDGETLTDSSTATFRVFRSETDAIIAQDAQASLTGGAIGPNEQLGGCGETRSTHAQATDYPVDTATGNFWHTFTDLSLPARGPDIKVERSYNSRLAAVDSPFGYGWSDQYGQYLEIGTSSVVLHGCNGSQTTFTEQSGEWQAPPRVLGELSQNGDGTWTYTRAAHDKFSFNSDGRLTAIADLNGETTRVSYPDSSTRVVTDPAGRALTFTLTNGHVTHLRDSSTPARTVSYDYDGVGNLTHVLDVGGGHWTFTYDDQHRMLTMRSPKFHGINLDPAPVVTTHYDAQGRVDWQTDQLGRKTTLDYTTIPGSTIVTNPAGNATEYDYNADGLLVAEVKGYGSTAPSYSAYRYDPDTLGRTVVVDGNGEVWRASYEPDGDRSTDTDPLGHVTTYTYNSLHQVTSVTSPRKINGQPITTELTYDATGNLETRKQPLLDQVTGAQIDMAVTQFEHSDPAHPGDLTAVVDPNGHRTTQTFDSYGNLKSITRPPTAENPDGNTTGYGYDTMTGWLKSTTSPRGNIAGAEPDAFTTTFGHDAYGQPTWTRSPLWDPQAPTANRTLNEYDLDGQLKSVTDGNGNATTYTYDPAGQLTKVHRADGTDVLTSFKPDGNIADITDAALHKTKFEYDVFGRLKSRTDPLSRTTTYTRDGVGNITRALDPQNRQTTYTRNAANQVTAITFSAGGPANVTNVTYDAEGHRIGATDASGTSTWSYDSLGRLAATTDGPGNTTTYHYDLAGRQHKIDYPNNFGSVTRTFDDADRVVALSDLASQDFGFTYDPDSNPASASYPNGTQTAYTINPGNQITAINHAPQSTPNQPFASFDYTYDGASQVKSVTSTGVPADSHTYGYDALNQLTTIDGTTLTYDAAGNLTKRPDGMAQAYDAANQLTTVTGPSISRVGTSSTSGSTGTTLTLNLPTGVQARDQAIAAVSLPDGKTITGFAGYTLFGTYKSGGTKAGQIALYRRTVAAGESSATISFQGKFAKTAVLAVYRNVDPNTPIRTHTGSGQKGTNVTVPSLTASNGDQLIWVGGASGTAGTWTPPAQMTLRVSKSDASTDAALADEVLTADGTTGTRTATHSTSTALSGALVALRPVSTSYTWSQAGRRSTTTDGLSENPTTSTHSFDTAGQLASWVSGSSSTSYKYNLDGLRSSKTTGSSTAVYTWDPTTPNPKLLSDGTAAYIYGPFGQPLERVASTGDVTYYAQDLLGSTRAITDNTGAVKATYTYDPYGRTTATTGSTTNPLTYTGQYQDVETGYLYLRMRYYDPTTGSFISRDPLEDATGSPYGYVNNNPTNLTDPSGLCPPCAVLAGIAIGAAVDVAMQALNNAAAGCDPLHDINWTQAAIWGGVGGISGGLSSMLRAANVASKFGSLTHSSSGIASFSTQRALTAGHGGSIQAHHLIERRFANVMGGNTNDWATIVVTRSEHQVFTNAWRQAIPYGAGTRTASRSQIEGAGRQIYSDYPEILKALGLG